jgi:lysophospholipase L1-like esterase
VSLTLKLVLSPLLVAQAVRTRWRMPRLPEAEGERHGRVGSGPVLRLLVAGDSSAAGVGVVHQRDALAGQLAARLAQACGATVDWALVAGSGLTTAQTLHRLQRETLPHFDVAVVVTGVNDVVDQVPSHHAVSSREALANWLRNSAGVHHVVFMPLPPVHHFPGLPQPLRWVAGSDARRHDQALARWAATRADVSRLAMTSRSI